MLLHEECLIIQLLIGYLIVKVLYVISAILYNYILYIV